MGSYGVGISRLVGAIIESSHDDKGIIWPKEVAPYFYNLINLNVENEECNILCLRIYEYMLSKNIKVLYDEKNESIGSKLARADLIGLPFQIIVGPRGLKEGLIEIKNRSSNKIEKIKPEELFNFVNLNKI